VLDAALTEAMVVITRTWIRPAQPSPFSLTNLEPLTRR
jgi:hypothetical protein